MTTKSQEINTLRRRAFAIVKTGGLDGQEAVNHLRTLAGVAKLDTLDATGWRALVGKLTGRTPVEVMAAPSGCTAPQWRKLMTLKRDLKMTDAKFRAEVKRVAKVEHEGFLDVPRARALIAALVSTLNYKAKKPKPANKVRPRPKLYRTEVRS